ncbi:glycosyltransferase [Sporofaciens musculi]|uniref:glycosyltransferase n=1 Tax=Sporofaciens musculi TaxID=2681861 RepID=UPI0025A2DB43|nr:glycosyltransferase [Sporofaciens musculi]
MNDIKVSVIMPSLNVAEYIEKAVRSVCMQSLYEIEIICIDATSTDGTWEILNRLADEDSRIILVKSDRRSYGYQVNCGMEMARGEYIAILETDDYISDGMYEKLYCSAKEGEYEYVKCDYAAYWTQANGKQYMIHKKAILSEELYDKAICPVQHISLATDDWYLWNGIYKKTFLDKNGIHFSESEGAAFQDIGFLHRTIIGAKKARYIHGEYYYYCIEREGASSNSRKDLEYAYQEYKMIYESLGHNDEKEKTFFYQRIAKSFVLACRNNADIDAHKDTQMQYEWFRDILKRGFQEKVISMDRIPQGINDDLYELMISPDSFKAYKKRKKEEFLDFLGEPGHFPIVIFGCGNYGCMAYQILRRNGYKVYSFMDNNSALWGQDIDGTRIESPKLAAKYGISARYLIANENHTDKMEQQIKEIIGADTVMTFRFRPEIN